MHERPLKLVHTSDVHLDSRFTTDTAGEYRNGAERAFAAVVQVALDESADLLLIVGDLFDNNRVPNEDFEFVCNQLQRLSCATVLLPGNHDVHDDYSVWYRIELATAGNHVHAVLDHRGDLIEFPELGARVWGKAMAEHAPENAPLAGTPEPVADGWNIGLAHGQVVEKRAGIGSSQITKEEIRNSGFDYLALGHVHVWGDKSAGATTACYPGSPVAAYASASGGHVAIARLSADTGVSLTQHLVDRQREQRGVEDPLAGIVI